MFAIVGCCCIGLISCEIAVSNYRSKQANLAGIHSADCTGFFYWREQQLTTVGGFFGISMCY